MPKATDKSDYFELLKEARVFGLYLLKQQPDIGSQELYAKALQSSPADKTDNALRFAINHPWSITFLDSGLALISPQAELRRRIYIMFAILEASPKYCDFFLSKKRSLAYPLFIIYVGLRSMFKALVGILLIKVVAR